MTQVAHTVATSLHVPSLAYTVPPSELAELGALTYCVPLIVIARRPYAGFQVSSETLLAGLEQTAVWPVPQSVSLRVIVSAWLAPTDRNMRDSSSFFIRDSVDVDRCESQRLYPLDAAPIHAQSHLDVAVT